MAPAHIPHPPKAAHIHIHAVPVDVAKGEGDGAERRKELGDGWQVTSARDEGARVRAA